MWLLAAPAAAHTAFESSAPADGAVVDEPVTEITLIFTGDATPAGEGFVVLDPTGVVRVPDDVASADNLTWTLRFDEPVAAGDVGVRWMVAAPDGHPIEGSFRFTVTAPDSGTDAPAATAPDNETDAPAVTAPDNATDAPAVAAPDNETDAPAVSVGDADQQTTTTADGAALDDFLDTDTPGPTAASTLATLARIATIVGAVLAIGGAAFTAFGLRGSRRDIPAVLSWVRRGGALVGVGAAVEAATHVTALAGSWSGLTSQSQISAALWSSTGLALALRLVGGFVIASRTPSSTAPATAIADPVLAARRLTTVGAGHTGSTANGRQDGEPFVYADDHAWDHRFARSALTGVAMVALSFAFDGHTASEGPRWLHAIVNLVHVTTAATWAGGVAMLVYVIGRRHRRDEDPQALQLAMRFSVIATVALVAAGAAGIALSIIVVDPISAIWSTPWGRLLMVKVALVGVAALGGAYNHRVVVPALDREPDDQATIGRFRAVVTVEAIALILVAAVTALLVGASAT